MGCPAPLAPLLRVIIVVIRSVKRSSAVQVLWFEPLLGDLRKPGRMKAWLYTGGLKGGVYFAVRLVHGSYSPWLTARGLALSEPSISCHFPRYQVHARHRKRYVRARGGCGQPSPSPHKTQQPLSASNLCPFVSPSIRVGAPPMTRFCRRGNPSQSCTAHGARNVFRLDGGTTCPYALSNDGILNGSGLIHFSLVDNIQDL